MKRTTRQADRQATKRAAIYCRISDDKAGAGLGVARQRADCEALAATRGWAVAEVYTDNSISAYSGKPRPGYEAMLEAAEGKQFDVILAWHTDRLHRSPRDLEQFIDVIERAKVEVVTVRGGDMDLSTPTGRAMARYMGVGARLESEHKSDRIRRKMLEKAQRGEPTGSRRPYGFEPDKVTHREAEADVIREMADRILAGETPYALARDLNRRGIPSATGSKWSTNALKRIMVSPRIAGLRQHLSRETGTPEPHGGLFREGDLYDAVWKPIIPRRKWERVRAKADPAERRNGTGRKYLLTGLLVCHACGRHLVGQPNAGHPAYQCATAAGGCGKVCAKAEPLETYVEGLVRRAIANGDLNKGTPRGKGERLAKVCARLATVDEEMRALEDERAAGMWKGADGRARWHRMFTPLADEHRDLTAERDRLEGAQDRKEWTAERWAIEWERDDSSARRAAMLRTVLRPLTVGPGRPGRGSRPAERLSEPVWAA